MQGRPRTGRPDPGPARPYRNDPRATRLDLGVGVYKDAQGLTSDPALGETRRAAPGRAGNHQELRRRPRRCAVRRAPGGTGARRRPSPLLLEQRADATQTPGGTGALTAWPATSSPIACPAAASG
ncbi:hypothetical protein ACPA9J_10770 [Pseudomonas aeruginosa]